MTRMKRSHLAMHTHGALTFLPLAALGSWFALAALNGCSAESLSGTTPMTKVDTSTARALERKDSLNRKENDPKVSSASARGTGTEGLTGSKGTVLPRCNAKPSNAGPKIWRLTPTQWAASLRALGANPDAAGFPPDSKAGRFDNNPSGLILRNAHAVFFEAQSTLAAPAVVTALRASTACAKQSPQALSTEECRAEFSRVAIEAIFRRPPEAEEVSRHAATLEKLVDIEGKDAALNDFVALLLRSPHFLFRTHAPQDGETQSPVRKAYAIASHLSFTLTDAPPDAELKQAARSGALLTREGLARETGRLVKSEAGKAKFIDFAKQWLLISHKPGFEPERDSAVFADYSAALYRDMVLETEEFLRQEVLGSGASVRTAFSSTQGQVTSALSAYYDGNRKGIAPGGTTSKVDLGERGRFGLLTHGSVLVALSQRGMTHALHRANTVRSHFLCYPLPGPPSDAVAQAKDKNPPTGPTTEKMRFESFLKTARSDCASCHATFVPYGLALENWGADGRFRQRDGTLDIDSSGTLPAPHGTSVRFKTGFDFLTQLASWDATAHCTMLHAHEFHWGSKATAGHSCALEAQGKASSADTPLIDVYLAPVADPAFFDAW
jgi:hypothetical protein